MAMRLAVKRYVLRNVVFEKRKTESMRHLVSPQEEDLKRAQYHLFQGCKLEFKIFQLRFASLICTICTTLLYLQHSPLSALFYSICLFVHFLSTLPSSLTCDLQPIAPGPLRGSSRSSLCPRAGRSPEALSALVA